jgi:muramoyltetrapeptide carboxypeptidase LdcA involved in peptidoglycan recycling
MTTLSDKRNFMKYKKPAKLKQGDVVAIVSPSWGGPSVFPHVYENGLKILTEWGLKINRRYD